MIISNQLRKFPINNTLVRRANNFTSVRNNSDDASTKPALDESQIKKIYPSVEQKLNSEGFPILKLMPSGRTPFTERTKFVRRSRMDDRISKNREESFSCEIDWPSIWPTPKNFVPSAVPLPMRQSFEEKNLPPRGKYRNVELLKIQNFLHLTPVAIERHCKALKKFCTAWPEGLDSEEEVRHHFPVTYVTKSYVHSAPTIRDARARVVKLLINVDDLKLAPLDRDKLIRLARHRYNKDNGVLTITASACPTRVQNKDYTDYLITALYFESINHADWETDKPECDWETFFWEKSRSKEKAKEYISIGKIEAKEEDIEEGKGIVEDYKKGLEKVFHEESYENLELYRRGVAKMLGIEINK